MFNQSDAWSFNLSPIGLLGWVILCCRGHPVHCGTFSSIPSLRPLDAKAPPPLPCLVVTINKLSGLT